MTQSATGCVRLMSPDGSQQEVVDLGDYEWRWRSAPRNERTDAALADEAPAAAIANTPAADPPQEGEDYWEQQGSQWIRHHVKARRALFTPIRDERWTAPGQTDTADRSPIRRWRKRNAHGHPHGPRGPPGSRETVGRSYHLRGGRETSTHARGRRIYRSGDGVGAQHDWCHSGEQRSSIHSAAGFGGIEKALQSSGA